MRFSFALNGTDINPFAQWGLSQNPIPSSGNARWDAHVLHLQALGGDPIPHDQPGEAEAYIRKHLRGYSKAFVDRCVGAFQPGIYHLIHVEFPDTAPYATELQQ